MLEKEYYAPQIEKKWFDIWEESFPHISKDEYEKAKQEKVKNEVNQIFADLKQTVNSAVKKSGELVELTKIKIE